MRLFFILYYIYVIFVVILNAAKTTVNPKVEDVVQRGSELCNYHTCETTVTPKMVVDDQIAPIKDGGQQATTIKPGKTTTKSVEGEEGNDESEPIKSGKVTTIGKPPPDPPAASSTTKSGNSANSAAAATTTSEPIASVGKGDKTTVALGNVKVTTVAVEDNVIPTKNSKTTVPPKIVEDDENVPVNNGKQTTTAKPGKATTKTIVEDENDEIEPVKTGEATTIGKPPPDPPADLIATTKSGKAEAAATTAKAGNGAATTIGAKTTIKPAAETTIKVVAATTITPKAASKTTTVATTTRKTTTTTTTTTPAPAASNGFLTFIKDAANIRPTFSVCGYFCNILGIKTRKKRLMDYSSLLAGLNQRDANFKAINKADFKLAIERSNGLFSPAIAAIQSQDLS